METVESNLKRRSSAFPRRYDVEIFSRNARPSGDLRELRRIILLASGKLIVSTVVSSVMGEPDFDSFDHESHMQSAIELAENAAKRGDKPYGSVLVHEDSVIMTESNREITENDIRRHPELHLAHRACRGFTPEKRARIVMYTSTEPCPMCAGGMVTAGFGRVVYSVGNDELTESEETTPSITAKQILGGITEVEGPVLNEEGRQIHREYSQQNG